MNRMYATACLLLLTISFLHCRKEVSYIGAPDPDPVVFTPDPITAVLQGNITDENNQPAAGVTVTAGTQTALTNTSGYFRITGAALDKNTALVTAGRTGYFKAYRVFSATSGTNQISIKLVKKNLAGSITAASGGSISLTNGLSVSLPAGGVVMAASGAAFSGEVKVYAAYIDPKAADISQTVPGSFAGDDKDGRRVVLSSYGMLAVELESAAGEKLQIKQGAAAKLTVPIPAAALSTAPATIPLWYVDEKTGLWKEEGTATRQGANYTGEVAHFSYWNCDRPFSAVSLSLTLVNAKGQPLVHINTRVTVVDSSGAVAYGITDSLGKVKGMVPAGKKLLLEVLDPCNSVLYSQSIDPLTQNKDLGNISVSNPGSSLITFSGKLLNCNGQPVKNGYTVINFKNIIRYASTDTGGKYTATLVVCSGTAGTAQIIGTDQSTQQQSPTSTVTVVSPNTDAGSLTACGVSALETINYTLDGVATAISSAAGDSLMAYRTAQNTSNPVINFSGMKKTVITSYIDFSAKGATATGSYPLNSLATFRFNNVVLKQPFTITFTSFAKSVGEFYEGSFSGQFTADSSAALHTISTTFRLRSLN